jgi:two-component system response regulator AtoC
MNDTILLNCKSMKKFKNNLVFIVEDNEMYSLMMDYMLSNEYNYQFMSFKTAEECIENLHLKPAIIIMDYHLPGINGKDAFLQIKKFNPEIPVIILTADHDIQIARELLKEGVHDYLIKEKDAVSQVKNSINSVLNKTRSKKLNLIRSLFHWLF